MPWNVYASFNFSFFLLSKIRTDPLCSACGEEEETPYHFLGKCCARMLDRMSVFGSYLLDLEELRKVKPISLVHFLRTTKRFVSVTYDYIEDVNWTEVKRPQRWAANNYCMPRR